METLLKWANDNYAEFVSNKNVGQTKVDVTKHTTKEDLAKGIENKATNHKNYGHDWLAELRSNQIDKIKRNNNFGVINDEIKPKQKIPRKIDGSSYVFLND